MDKPHIPVLWKQYNVESGKNPRTHITLHWINDYRVSLCGREGTVGVEWLEPNGTYCKRCIQLAKKHITLKKAVEKRLGTTILFY